MMSEMLEVKCGVSTHGLFLLTLCPADREKD